MIVNSSILVDYIFLAARTMLHFYHAFIPSVALYYIYKKQCSFIHVRPFRGIANN